MSLTQEQRANEAVVIKVGDRFFAGLSKTGMVQTAWSLAGATLYGEWRDDLINADLAKVRARRKRDAVSLVKVAVVAVARNA